MEVLVVEDNLADVLLLEEAFRDVNPSVHLHVASDGLEAMAYLKNARLNVTAPRPDLIFLDLNLPKMGGREVLAHIKLDEELKSIPTLILTSSGAEADIVKSYQLHANSYLTKPMQLESFQVLVRSINDFWLIRAKLPSSKKVDAPKSN
jgi:chemotaxis family two-component system response regulator Rcp1